MEEVAVLGVDLAKSVFQVHGVAADGRVVLRRKLSRSNLLSFFAKLPRCLIGMETCASANYWARELIALGHEVRLMPPQYVKPYVKRSKNDASDAEAICEAVTRPTMRLRIEANADNVCHGRLPFVGLATTSPWHIAMPLGAVHPNNGAQSDPTR